MRDFFEHQLGRAKLRAWIILHGVKAALFWTIYFVAWTYAVNAGIGWLGWIGLAAYVFAAMPVLVLQIILIADLLAYLVIGKIFAYPELSAASKKWASDNEKSEQPSRVASKVVLFLFDVSPISSLAVWSLLVLARMPERVHGELKGPTRLKKQETDLAVAIYGSAYGSAARRLRAA